jgi:hypothetical protein
MKNAVFWDVTSQKTAFFNFIQKGHSADDKTTGKSKMIWKETLGT